MVPQSTQITYREESQKFWELSHKNVISIEFNNPIHNGDGIWDEEYQDDEVNTDDEKDEDFEPLFYKPYEQYLTKIRAAEGNPTSLILGLPLGMPKADLLRQISKLIDYAKVPLVTKSARASKALAAKRLRSEPLFIQLRILMAKAQYPDMQLWKVGLWAKVSAKHAKTLDLKESKKKFEDADSKEHLAILTSRAFKNAKQVAENAARGSFPSSKPVKLPNYDFDDIYTRIRTHYKTLKPR
jgi:hypothetical protein